MEDHQGPSREERLWKEECLEGASMLAATYHGQSFARHVHETFVIGVDTGGLSSTWYRGEERILCPGHLLVLNPGEVQTGRQLSDEPWRCRALYPTPEFLQSLYRESTGKPDQLPQFRSMSFPDPDLVRRFLHAHQALEADEDPLQGESEMLAFLTILLERHGSPWSSEAADRSPNFLTPVLDYMEDNLEQPIRVSDLAEAAGYSRFHFIRLFLDTVGITPYAYLTQRRVERARRLLKEGWTPASVAYTCGFSDQSHLTRRFRQYVGVTPGEFARGCR